jgi:chitinase
LQKNIAAKKLVIGAAFYARVFENVAATNNGLYQSGKFKNGVSCRNFQTYFLTDSGYNRYWDSVAQAPYVYNQQKNLFGTFDDSTSIRLKTKYAIEQGLDGIMFWQLADDRFFNGGLLDVIDEVKRSYKK